MAKSKTSVPVEDITRSIVILRGHRVLLDSELARIYGVETRVLNQAVKRNAERFPDDFRFQLTAVETAASRSQSGTLKPSRGQNIKFLPYAFTEHPQRPRQEMP
jgi:ORF6N domain